MTVSVRYFASIREALGPGEAVEVAGGSTVGAVRDVLIARGGAHASALARGRALRSALNQVLCDETAAVARGDEVAFFPPVTGG
ncbi:MAG: MoaD/ThiS family protein [Burkholderiales bacterium]|nr:MoaD/ThiS family protein [Burkholderiales bacterium]